MKRKLIDLALAIGVVCIWTALWDWLFCRHETYDQKYYPEVAWVDIGGNS